MKKVSEFEFQRLKKKSEPSNFILHPSIFFETQAIANGYKFIAGVDEVGRGCLAGSVVACAAILDLSKPLPKGLNDSKKIPAKRREIIADQLIQSGINYAFGEVTSEEIDEINILQATKKAMRLAIEKLNPSADFLLIDALELKDVNLPQTGIIRGDSISASIAAASILAKTFRDNQMREYSKIFPQYGFEKHAGYGTKFHYEALRKYGAIEIHRKTFRGVIN